MGLLCIRASGPIFYCGRAIAITSVIWRYPSCGHNQDDFRNKEQFVLYSEPFKNKDILIAFDHLSYFGLINKKLVLFCKLSIVNVRIMHYICKINQLPFLSICWFLN